MFHPPGDERPGDVLSPLCCGMPRGLVFPPWPATGVWAATGGFPPAAGPVEAGSSGMEEPPERGSLWRPTSASRSATALAA